MSKLVEMIFGRVDCCFWYVVGKGVSKYELYLCQCAIDDLWHIPSRARRITISLWSNPSANRVTVIRIRSCVDGRYRLRAMCPDGSAHITWYFEYWQRILASLPEVTYAQVEYQTRG